MAQVRSFCFDGEPSGIILVDNETGFMFPAFEICCKYDTYTEEVEITDYTTEVEKARELKNVRFAVEPNFETLDNYEVEDTYNQYELDYTDIMELSM